MTIFKPTAIRESVVDITPELLKSLGVTTVLLDVDNTLASYSSHEPVPGAVSWTKSLVRAGFKLVIVSNNYKKRVKPFAAKFDLQFITFAMKPLPFGYMRAKKLLNTNMRNCVIVGDQIFTDVLGANLCGMKSILLTPVEMENGASIRFRRKMEKSLREKFKSNQSIMK